MYFRNKDGKIEMVPEQIPYSKLNEYVFFKKYGRPLIPKEKNIVEDMCKFVVYDKKIDI